jgi:hypothetical protein
LREVQLAASKEGDDVTPIDALDDGPTRTGLFGRLYLVLRAGWLLRRRPRG